MATTPRRPTKKRSNAAPTLEINLPDPLDELKKVKRDIARTLDEVQNAKKDFIAIFGLFAGVLIFLSLEVKLFDQTQRMATTMGISFFFLAALLIFALGVRSVFSDKNNWKEFTKPAFVFALVFLVISLECFYWSTHTNPHTHHGQYWFLVSR
jgi:hypothetical protein